jgi:hypothetical protein
MLERTSGKRQSIIPRRCDIEKKKREEKIREEKRRE